MLSCLSLSLWQHVGRSDDAAATADTVDAVHRVIHYWYSSWPDHQAPRATGQLLRLVVEVERLRLDPDTGRHSGPVIVHCRSLSFFQFSLKICMMLVEKHIPSR